MLIPPQNESSEMPFKNPQAAVRIMQILILSLMLGMLIFAGIAVLVNSQPRPEQKVLNSPIVFTVLGVIAAVINIVLRIFVPGLVSTAVLKNIAKKRGPGNITKLDIYPAYLNGLLVGAALLEGAAFFNIVAVLITREYWTLGVAGVLFALMAAAFPTFDRVDYWAEEQLRDLQRDPPVINQ